MRTSIGGYHAKKVAHAGGIEEYNLPGALNNLIGRAQARDAGKSGDWTRAQNLAQKARLLSIELANSF